MLPGASEFDVPEVWSVSQSVHTKNSNNPPAPEVPFDGGGVVCWKYRQHR